MSDHVERKAVDCCLEPRHPAHWAKVAELHREYMRAIQPLIKMKSDIYATSPPVIIFEPDGNMRSEYRFNESALMTLEAIDSAINATKKSFFGDNQST